MAAAEVNKFAVVTMPYRRQGYEIKVTLHWGCHEKEYLQATAQIL